MNTPCAYKQEAKNPLCSTAGSASGLLSPLQSYAPWPRLTLQAPGILNCMQFFRPLLMPFPSSTMPFQSSPLVLYLNILHGSSCVTSSMKDFPTPEGVTLHPLFTTLELYPVEKSTPVPMGSVYMLAPPPMSRVSYELCLSANPQKPSETRPVIY